MALRFWSSLVLAPLLATAACHDDGGGPGEALPAVAVPRGAELPPFAIQIVPTYATKDGFLPRPKQLDGHLYLRVDQAGLVTGTLSLTSGAQSVVLPVTGRVTGDAIAIDADSLSSAGGLFQWSELTLTLLDGDDDGTIDTGVAVARGTFSQSSSEFFEVSPYTALLSAQRDTVSSSAAILDSATRLPFGLVTIDFAEPVRADQATASLHVLADGRPVAGRFEVSPVDGLITNARFQPADFLPFDQAISLDVSGLTDPAGNAITAAASDLRVVPDPSPITENLGFENGLSGWTVVGHAQSTGSFGGVAPVEGKSQAVIDAVGTLAGYLDVPGDASALHVSLARLSQLGEIAEDYNATIKLHRANGDKIASFDARDASEKLLPCTACAPTFGFQLGPLTRDLDLTAVRGERVWVTIDATAFFFIGVPPLSVVVDDLRIVK